MRNNRYTKLFTLALCVVIGSIEIKAQSAVLATGGDATGNGGSVAYSVGQAAYTYMSGEEGSVNLGVQQPHFVIKVDTDEPGDKISAAVFPNPANDAVALTIDQQIIDDITKKDLSFSLYDMDGTLIMQQDIVAPLTNVSLENLPDAVYVLRITSNHEEVKAFKIIKTN